MPTQEFKVQHVVATSSTSAIIIGKRRSKNLSQLRYELWPRVEHALLKAYSKRAQNGYTSEMNGYIQDVVVLVYQVTL